MQENVPESLQKFANQLVPRLVELEEERSAPILLIEGRAGSGKSSLASFIQNEFYKVQKRSPRVIHMDDLYPGWEGLEAGSQYLLSNILRPFSASKEARWQQWDWASGRRGGTDPGNGWRSLEPNGLLIVEGCGSGSIEALALADYSVWIESSHEIRRTRFNQRDDGLFASKFELWSAQEDAFYSENDTRALSDVVIQN